MAEKSDANPVADDFQPAEFREVKEIANRSDAEVRVHKQDIFKRPPALSEPTSPVRQLFNKLLPRLQAHMADIEKAPGKFSSLVKELGVVCDDQSGKTPRLVVSSGPSVYVIVQQWGDQLEAQLYAHIPAEVNNLVVPWLKEEGAVISQSTFIRPSGL